MQLSASTLPFDPAAALPGGLPVAAPGLPTGVAAPAEDGFGSLLSAETDPLAAEGAAPAPAPAGSSAASATRVAAGPAAELNAWAVAMGFAPAPAPRPACPPETAAPEQDDASLAGDGGQMFSTAGDSSGDTPAPAPAPGAADPSSRPAAAGSARELPGAVPAPLRASLLVGRDGNVNTPPAATPRPAADRADAAPAQSAADDDDSATASTAPQTALPPPDAVPAPASGVSLPVTAAVTAGARGSAPADTDAVSAGDAAARIPVAAPAVAGSRTHPEPTPARSSRTPARPRASDSAETESAPVGQGSAPATEVPVASPEIFATAAALAAPATPPTSPAAAPSSDETAAELPATRVMPDAPRPSHWTPRSEFPVSTRMFTATATPSGAASAPTAGFAAARSFDSAPDAGSALPFTSAPAAASTPPAATTPAAISADPVDTAADGEAMPPAPVIPFAPPAPVSREGVAAAASAKPAASTVSLPAELRENFAAAVAPIAEAVRSTAGDAKKDSLVSSSSAVTRRATRLGTNVAKNGSNMPALAPNVSRPSSDAASSASTAVPAVLDFAALADEQAQPAVSSASSAHEAVESVLAVTDHFTTGGQHGVNLKFTVSGIDLAVRVEVRGGTVQATFRTDSPELRAALATEWHAVTTESGARSAHLADPVFAPAAGSRDALQSDAGSLDQRGSQPRQEPAAFADQPAFRGLSRRASVAVPSVPGFSSPTAPVATPGRLHVLA